MMQTPVFSVVLVNYADSWDLIRRCVLSLEASARHSGTSFEVVVVDNDEDAKAPGFAGDVRIFRSGRNVGFARAVNRGISASSGEFVVLINPDSTVPEVFFGDMERFLAGHPGVGVVGPRILDSDGTLQLSARREISLVSGILGRTSSLTRLLPDSSFVRDQFPAASATSPTKVDWVSGACMVVRREVLYTVGPLDERFFMYFEDADLCRRARNAGFAVYYLPHVEVVHEAGGSTRSKPQATLNLHKSAFLYHRKHGRRGPLGVYSGVVAAGLVARGGVRLARGWLHDRAIPETCGNR